MSLHKHAHCILFIYRMKFVTLAADDLEMRVSRAVQSAFGGAS